MPAKTAVKKPAPDYGEFTPHPAADVFPLMREEDLQKLADDIRQCGQLDDIEVLEGTSQIIDGRNRYLACRLAGVEPRTKEISMDGMPYGIYEYAVSKNLLRRQLTAGQRQAVVTKLREGGHSIRAIAELTGIPKSTVADDLRQASETGQFEQPDRIEGKDGRERPATMPPSQPSQALDLLRAAVGKLEGFADSLQLVTIPDDVPSGERGALIKSLRKNRAALGQFIKRLEGDQPESLEPEITAAGDEPSTKQVNDWLKSEGRGSEVTRGQVSKALKKEYLAAHMSAES
jgi:transposase-like protein